MEFERERRNNSRQQRLISRLRSVVFGVVVETRVGEKGTFQHHQLHQWVCEGLVMAWTGFLKKHNYMGNLAWSKGYAEGRGGYGIFVIVKNIGMTAIVLISEWLEDIRKCKRKLNWYRGFRKKYDTMCVYIVYCVFLDIYRYRNIIEAVEIKLASNAYNQIIISTI